MVWSSRGDDLKARAPIRLGLARRGRAWLGVAVRGKEATPAQWCGSRRDGVFKERTVALLTVPAEEYHRRELGVVSNSALAQIARSPAHYRAWVAGLRGTSSSPALEFGRVLHVAVLEPERFQSEYVVAPDFGDCRRKGPREARDAWRAEHAGAEHVSHEWHEMITGMAESIKRHPMARRIMRDGLAEQTIRWHDPETGLECKARPDYYVLARRLVADLKSCEDASCRGFAKAVANRYYHRQDALYRAGMAESGERLNYFLFIAVEKEPPYACAVHSLDQEAIGAGYRIARSGIDTMHECMQTGEWPSYSDGITELSLPPWAV